MSFLNSRDFCIACFEKKEDDYELIKHHVSYFPEVCTWVHYKCHTDIHDEPSKYPFLIQYQQGDSRKFYDLKKEDER